MTKQELIELDERRKHVEFLENAVVLTREEFERIKGFSREEVDEISETAKKNSRKETAEEFAERLKNGLSNCSGCYIPDCFESPTDEFAYSEKDLLKLIDELLKEYEK